MTNLLDRLFNALMGAFLTLLFLTQFGRGDFLREAGFVLLPIILLTAYDLWQHRKMSQGIQLSIHLVVSAFAFLTCAGMFIVQHLFGVDAAGYWMFLPVIIFFWASWTADREADVARD